jgi:integrase
MGVRKRNWITKGGEAKSAWVVEYTDAKGTRRLKTFPKKKDADAFDATTKVEIRDGVHVADSASITIEQAGKFWLATGEANGLERTTLEQYRQHVNLHIVPLIGSRLLSRANVPDIRAFEDEMRDTGRSPAMVKKVRGSLGAIFADAQERGLATRNPVREMAGRRKPGKERRQDKRRKGRLKIGVDIPMPQEIKSFVGAASGRWRPVLLTAVFAGLRASELRGLRWEDIELDAREIRVHQRADRFNALGQPKSVRFNALGQPKSVTSERSVPIPNILVNTLREWRLSCPRRDTGRHDAQGNPIRVLDLAFPNGAGKVESHANIINRGLVPTWIAAGVCAPLLDESGLPVFDKQGAQVMTAKYTGLHSLRHFLASWLINPPALGGMGLLAKVVQDRLGHSTIAMTMDTYGHLFPRGDDADELAAAEKALLG